MSKKQKELLERDDFAGSSKAANMATKANITGNRMMRKLRR